MPKTVWMQFKGEPPEELEADTLTLAAKMVAGYRQVPHPSEPRNEKTVEVPTFPPQPGPPQPEPLPESK